MKRSRIVLLAAAATLSLAATAQDKTLGSKTGAPNAPSEAPVSMCIGCHAIPGYQASFPQVYRVPKIGGQSPQYLVNALNDYRQGKRKHPTMQAQAQSFSDQDIADIAAFLTAVK